MKSIKKNPRPSSWCCCCTFGGCRACLLTLLFVLLIMVALLVYVDNVLLRLPDLTHITQVWTTLPKITQSLNWDGIRPLNIVFLTWGTRGDHQPNVALGLELAKRGHNVTVLGLSAYRDCIEQHHPLLHYGLLQDDHIQHLIDAFVNATGMDVLTLSYSYSINTGRQLVKQYLQYGQHADVLIGHHNAMMIVHHLTVAQKLQKPLFLTTHDLTVPTASYSFNMDEFRVKDYGRRTNVGNYRIFSLLFGAILTFGKKVPWRVYRKDLSLTTPWPIWEFLHPTYLADFPIFYTADPTLWSPPKDHPPHWYSTGFFVTQTSTRSDTRASESDEDVSQSTNNAPVAGGSTTASTTTIIQEWMNSRQHLHRPLLYFGQGSFRHDDQQMMSELLHDACETLDMDAVVLDLDALPIVDGLDSASLSSLHWNQRILPVHEIDHDWLFPKCHVIVHHGGAGTASQVIRSGKPGICLPSMTFQEIWGNQLQDYGAGILVRPDDARQAWYDTKNRTNLLTQAIQQVMTPAVQERAATLGELARQHSDTAGVKLAADKIEEHMRTLLHQKKQAHKPPVSSTAEAIETTPEL